MQKSRHRFGRFFYVTLACFLCFIILLGGISIFINLIALNRQQAQASRITEALLNNNRERICSLMQQAVLEDIYAQLAFDTDASETDVQTVSEKISALDGKYTTSSFYVFYPESNILTGETAHKNCTDLAIDFLIQECCSQSSPSSSNEASGMVMLNADSSSPFSLRWYFPQDDCCFMMLTFGRPNVKIDPAVTEMLPDAEFYFYDSFGNVVPANGSSGRFSSALDYYSLGNAPDGSGHITLDKTPYNYS